MPAVTIDNYSQEIHERYASDQLKHDPTFLRDASEIPTHFNAAVTKTGTITKWEELFEIHLHKHPFASFFPPPRYEKMRNRFFNHSLSPEFDWMESNEDEEKEREKEKEHARQLAKLYKKKILSKGTQAIPLALFEKDRSALLNLIDSIQLINGFLKEINARKLQYQKG